MKWVYDFFKKKKRSTEESFEEETERIKKTTDKQVAKLREEEDEMVKKYCAIKDDFCIKECVHFQLSYIELSHSGWIESGAKCKLWGAK
jgi:hypothetical protein